MASVRQCQICHVRCPSLHHFVSHLRLVHSSDKTFSVRCNIGGCVALYKSFSAFSSHVYRNHRAELGLREFDYQHVSLLPTPTTDGGGVNSQVPFAVTPSAESEDVGSQDL